ncbi:hypothetical protein [Ureibacillus aquaedulcis]|uniref:Uncharacterized protein n=1 Tax=Ureibacillus aquaedulcis TaxID=3058421 RepID=A0ABT8GSK8_9BACL|nr:hypothetical protein [Ureibacillus sp. BA0131]MDN4494400.1 hypothetical protein [Ureibacillus sp. BA0131]
MKKLLLAGAGILLLAGGIIFYSEFRTVNFVDAFLTNPDELADKVHRVTIWGEGDHESFEALAIFNQSDEDFDEILAALSEWEVKRTLFQDIDYTNMYKMDIANNAQPINPVVLKITPDGMMNIHGKEYKLISGSSMEELIDIAK